MFKLESQEEIKQFEKLKKDKAFDLLREILVRELTIQHRYLENDGEVNSTFAIKGKCQAVRDLWNLLKKDQEEFVEDLSADEEPPSKAVKEISRIMKIIKAIGHLVRGPVKQ